MLFNSIGFVFYALPIFLTGYFLLGHYSTRSAALIWLVIVSLIFYASWDPGALFLLVGSTLLNFAIGRLMLRRPRPDSRRLLLLLTGLAANIGVLCYFKYANFIVDNLNALGDTDFAVPTIILPLAISFFTFQKIAYLVDVFRGDVKEHSFLEFCLFVTFFPQLIAGPIVHHSEMMPQFAKSAAMHLNPTHVAVGLTMFGIGLVKKVVFADTLATVSEPVFSAAAVTPAWPLTFFEAWGGVLAFAYQIYFDFSAYSDMALGIALMLNVRLPINFSSPYKATSIIELWRRWHMTLTRFLTDYVYSPLSLYMMRLAMRRRAGKWVTFALAVAIPVNITFLVSGIWHGAGWNFVLFGVVTGVAMTINFAWRRARLPAPPRIAGWLLTMFAFLVSIAFFRSESLDAAGVMLRGMFGLNGFALPADTRDYLGGLGDLLARAGWRFDDIVLAYLKLPGQALWLALLTFAVLLLPNTQDLLRPFRPALDDRPPDLVGTRMFGFSLDRLYGATAVRLFSSLSWLAGLSLGLGLCGLILYQSHMRDTIPQFIYFQF